LVIGSASNRHCVSVKNSSLCCRLVRNLQA
jgi:hypothetical protein